MAKKVDAVKAKEKRQKVIAAVGGLILVILLVIQGPKLLKHFHHSAPAAATPATVASGPATGSSTSLAAPTLAGANPTAPAAGSTNGSGTLTSGDAAPPVEQGQLASFSLFTSKDPFAQQISDGTNSTPTGSSGTGSSGSGTGTSGSGSTTPAPGTAVIAVNGTLMAVTVGSDFPQPTANDPSAQPLFHLVSLTAHTAKISIAGGSYTSGAAAVTLRENRPVTLLNTADGTRYKLVLKPQGTEVPAATTGSGTTTTTPTAPAP